jgi:hypothetical protein
MSIIVDNIYCKHWLKNNKLLEYINKTTYPVIINSPHHCFHIFDTIHYNSLLKDNYDIYNYLIIHTKQYEHSENNFKTLLNNFDISKINKINLEYDDKLDKYIVTDGVHRLCILLFKNIFTDKIPIEYFNIIYPQSVITKITDLLTITTNTKHYNGWNNNRPNMNGYHSLNIFNINLIGQRTPIKRIATIIKKYDFTDKIVLDLGCNIGGMLLHLPQIKKGIGIDFDETCINCGNYIANVLKFNDLNFYKYDLNNLSLIEKMNEFNIKNIDIIFLLSIGSWASNWKQLYSDCINNTKHILLETNNDIEGKPQLQLFKDYNCKIDLISEQSLDDNTGNYDRKLYLITI